jgi:hypothetical protein
MATNDHPIDPTTGSTYYPVSTAAVFGCVGLAELITVDVDKAGRPVGIEFAMSRPRRHHWAIVFDRYPALRLQFNAEARASEDSDFADAS